MRVFESKASGMSPVPAVNEATKREAGDSGASSGDRRTRVRMVGRAIERMVDGQIWRPSNCQMLGRHLIHRDRNRKAGFTDRDHLLAASVWLERAQDVTGNGGVAGRYLLNQGWTSAYPETTGYIIPTFLALSKELGSDRFVDRARQAVGFLLGLQLPDGAFPGGEIHENTTRPSVFNTAQILGGLTAWHAWSREEEVLAAACKAGDWLVSVQDEDGLWRRHTYNDLPVTYSAHASCWLAELGRLTGNADYLDAVTEHFNWVLARQDRETGWFDLAGFSREDHRARRALTHTIAYTLWGLLRTSEILNREDGIRAVEKAAAGVARRLELSRRLPGVLDWRWRSQAAFTCLTGNAQMALVWFRLYSKNGDVRFLNAALKALDEVKAAQPMGNREPGIHGGIPGSYPIWGDYIYMGLPNWAAKFVLDALMAKKAVIDRVAARCENGGEIVSDVPQVLPAHAQRSAQRALKVLMYTVPGSHKVQQMVEAWADWSFKPDVVILEKRPEPGWFHRLLEKMREDGLGWIPAHMLGKRVRVAQVDASAGAYQDIVLFCKERGIPIVEVGRLDSDEAMQKVQALEPDVAVHAGAGILRAQLLSIPRLGTLNAHMGLLPSFRGMNVAEWSFFEGGPVGCTVHLIDPGIDEGDILCARRVETGRVGSIRELRQRVDDAQIGLLGEVLCWILAHGELPPRRRQSVEEGRQYFRMHPELVGILEEALHRNVCIKQPFDLPEPDVVAQTTA